MPPPPPSSATPRRRTPEARRSCWTAAWHTALARWGSPIRRRARGRRSRWGGWTRCAPRSGDRRDPHRRVGLLSLVLVDVVVGRLVQEPEQNLLVVQGELRDGAGLEHRLRRLQSVAVLQAVLLEGHDGHLLGQPFARRLRRDEVARAFEEVGVVRRRP